MEALIVGAVLGLLNILMGLVIRNLNDSIKDLKIQDSELTKELTDVKINYVHKADLKDLKQEIAEKFIDLKQWIKEELKGQ